MPIYEYICQECGEEQEILQRFDDPPPQCENCDEDMEKVMSLSSFILKGKGWYISDYKKKKKPKTKDKGK